MSPDPLKIRAKKELKEQQLIYDFVAPTFVDLSLNLRHYFCAKAKFFLNPR